jgi:hypothetical protein
VYLYNNINPKKPTIFGIIYRPVILVIEKNRNNPPPQMGLVSLTKLREVALVSISAGKSSL